MSAPYFTDDQVTLHHGDALGVARTLPDGAADCIVTSPPYFGLRDYGIDGQYGLEASPTEYVETMRTLFSELRRVLADDGTLWLNIGDSYAGAGGPMKSDGSPRSESPSVQNPAASNLSAHDGQKPSYPSPNSENLSPQCLQGTSAMNATVGPLPTMKQGARDGNRRSRPRGYGGISPKSLIGIPWRVALALQDDGWILRNAIIWNKPNAMPEPVTDRLSGRYETVFMFSKAQRYWFDLDPIREQYSGQRDLSRRSRTGKTNKENSAKGAWGIHKHNPEPVPALASIATAEGIAGNTNGPAAPEPLGRNPGDVWDIPTQPFSAAHFAVMPQKLAQRCIMAGCKPGGTVLDPFSGSGTTGLAAQGLGRKYIGIDLNAEYLDLSLKTRLINAPLDFTG
jgi:DNA modification methylase